MAKKPTPPATAIAKAITSKKAMRAAKLRLFVDFYVANGHNAAQAYRDAGFTAKTPHTAAVEGAKLLRNPDILEAIHKRIARAFQTASLTTDEVLGSVARAVRFDPRRLVDENGKAKELKDLDEDTALAISAIEVGGMKIRVEKNAAREQAMKHLGLYKADNAQQPVPVVNKIGTLSVRLNFDQVRKSMKRPG